VGRCKAADATEVSVMVIPARREATSLCSHQ
jgi:hypothetical protein